MNKNEPLRGAAKFFICFMAVFFLFMAEPAHAYIDPGTGSVFLRVIVTTIAGIFFVGRKYIIIPIKKYFFIVKEIKKKLKKTLPPTIATLNQNYNL